MIKKTIATLLAAQLFIALGLCSFVCCIPVEAETPKNSHADHLQMPESAEGNSHCHAKAEKKAPVRPQVRVEAAQHCHSGKPAGRSFANSSPRICQCNASSQQNPDFSLTQSDFTQQKCAFASLPVWHDVDQSPPSPSASPPLTLSLAPPFSGFQLSLRV